MMLDPRVEIRIPENRQGVRHFILSKIDVNPGILYLLLRHPAVTRGVRRVSGLLKQATTIVTLFCALGPVC
jgi:hypothetical protein